MMVSSSFTILAANDEVLHEEFLGYVDLAELEESGEVTVSPHASFPISGQISAGATKYNSSTYYMTTGERYSFSVNWAPTGQSIKVVRYNIDTGATWGTAAYSGGSASGSITSSGPAGEYKFGIYNAGTKTITSMSATISL
ncbi:MAG TPA: hypothetical protein IAC41_05220 [Candidatus Merdenecus merdavium]|nr:hypothetical protein [Candidatus Merdenecus merdavium]